MCTGLKNSRYMQYLSAITATLSMAASAMYTYWTSPSLLVLQSDDSPVGRPISDEEGSWLVSLHKLAIIPSSVLGAWLVEKIGRKSTLLVSGVLLMLPWVVIILANTLTLVFIARLAGGIGSGLLIISCSIYNGEISENDIRGKLGTTLIALKLVGSLIVLCIGPYVSYTNLAFISIILPIVFVFVFVFMPESPYYLIKVKEVEQAEKSLRTLSSNNADDNFIRTRLEEIEQSVEEDMHNKTTVSEFLTNSEYRKAIIIILGIKTLQQFSGDAAISGYMQTIIASSSSNISQRASSLIFGFVQLPAVLLSSFLVDRIGRKPLLITSALGCALSLFVEGIFFYLQDVLKANVSSIAWIPTAGITLFQIMNPLGIVTLPYVLLGELFPTNIKGIAVALATLYGAIMAFVVTKFFKPLANAWGIYTVFWIFGVTCSLGAIFIGIMLPETKGKSFAEIQSILKGKKQDVESHEMKRVE